MIKNFIFVEDGSVDMDKLDDLFSSETKVIVYRQGASIPVVKKLEEPIEYSYEEQLKWKNIRKDAAMQILSYLKSLGLIKCAPEAIALFFKEQFNIEVE